MQSQIYPGKIAHWVNGQETDSRSGNFFPKYDPATGRELGKVVRGNREDVEYVITAAEKAAKAWQSVSPENRAEILKNAVALLQKNIEGLAAILALECGKSVKSARGEVQAASECGTYLAEEGPRHFQKPLPSKLPNRQLELIRQPSGIGALIVPFNSPLAGIAWKSFPALLCGNAVILKAHEYTPYISMRFAQILKEAGLPAGVFSVLQGLGPEVGQALIDDPRINFVSFTGSVATAQIIIKSTADRLTKVLIESGGKNPFVVCEDADLDKAADAAVASGFVDAGQRCAAASRIIVLEGVYDEFKKRFLEKVEKLRVGTKDGDDFGAIISEKRLLEIEQDVKNAVRSGARLLCGGTKLDRDEYQGGYFFAPTVLENIAPDAEISHREVFGPVVALYRARDFEEALRLANDSEFKLTGAIHTKDMKLAQEFIDRYQAGVVRVNGPTHGSEPHVPFGGLGLSGTGWREPGLLALDFYGEWKQVSFDE